MFGTLVLVFGALCCLSLAWGKQDYAAASIVVGFIVWGLVTSMGGPTGPGLNPARDLMPADPAQGLLPLGRGLDPGCGPDCRRHYRRLAVRVLLRQLIR